MFSSYSTEIRLSILFIPFDAAIQHYKRNADNGVASYWNSPTGLDPQAYGFNNGITESIGSAMTPSDISNNLPAIVESICTQMQGSIKYYLTPEQENALKARAESGEDVSGLLQRLTCPAKQFPHVIFLSEQPKGVEFPDLIKLPSSGVCYRQLPASAGSRRVQRIFAHVRTDMITDTYTWRAEATTKYSAQGKVEHVLLIEHGNPWTKCRFIGVRLSADNTGLNYSAQKMEANSLLAFCKHYNVDFAIGDFNMNMQLFDGHTGIRAGSTVYLAQATPNAHEILFQEHYTNSINTAHYMGYIIINSSRARITGMDAEGTYGASGARSISGRYYSDHAPIGVNLAFTN